MRVEAERNFVQHKKWDEVASRITRTAGGMVS